MVEAVRDRVDPTFTGPLLPATGAEGIRFTTTVVEPAELVHPPIVAVTLYEPAIADVALMLTTGFCDIDEKPLGPVQL